MQLSDEIIEEKANELRDRLGLAAVSAPDVKKMIETLPTKMKRFSVRLAQDGELEPHEAFMNCDDGILILSEEVSDDIEVGTGRARFTIAHEIGHYLLGHSGNTKRSSKKEKYLTPTQKRQEREADLFASYLLVPTKLARACESEEDVRSRFGVSTKAAKIAFERIQRVLRRERGEMRPTPKVVVDFLEEKRRRMPPMKPRVSEDGPKIVDETFQQTSSQAALVSHGAATFLGYTGNVCRDCGNFTMIRDGNCERCQTCGSSSGCS